MAYRGNALNTADTAPDKRLRDHVERLGSRVSIPLWLSLSGRGVRGGGARGVCACVRHRPERDGRVTELCVLHYYVCQRSENASARAFFALGHARQYSYLCSASRVPWTANTACPRGLQRCCRRPRTRDPQPDSPNTRQTVGMRLGRFTSWHWRGKLGVYKRLDLAQTDARLHTPRRGSLTPAWPSGHPLLQPRLQQTRGSTTRECATETGRRATEQSVNNFPPNTS